MVQLHRWHRPLAPGLRIQIEVLSRLQTASTHENETSVRRRQPCLVPRFANIGCGKKIPLMRDYVIMMKRIDEIPVGGELGVLQGRTQRPRI